MPTRSYSDEAKRCRELAADVADGPEKPFLLGVAKAFDDLAGEEPGRREGVIGPLGELLTLKNLPARDTTRWTVRRKAEVVAAVAGGLLTVDEACDRYEISLEEFAGWQRAVNRGGLRGLRVTRIQKHRHFHESVENVG